MLGSPSTSTLSKATVPTLLSSAKTCRKYAKAIPAASRVSASADNRPDVRSGPGFLDNRLTKQSGRQQAGGEIRSFSPNTPDPAPLGSSLAGFTGFPPSAKQFDRGLNLGVLAAAGAAALTAAAHAGPSPWQTYQDVVAVNPIETKVSILEILLILHIFFLRFPHLNLAHVFLISSPLGLHFWRSI